MQFYLKFFLNIFFLIFFLSPNAYAYFDPGTGAFIVQAILGFLAAVAATFAMMWTKVKMFFLKIFSKQKFEEQKKNK